MRSFKKLHHIVALLSLAFFVGCKDDVQLKSSTLFLMETIGEMETWIDRPDLDQESSQLRRFNDELFRPMVTWLKHLEDRAWLQKNMAWMPQVRSIDLNDFSDSSLREEITQWRKLREVHDLLQLEMRQMGYPTAPEKLTGAAVFKSIELLALKSFLSYFYAFVHVYSGMNCLPQDYLQTTTEFDGYDARICRAHILSIGILSNELKMLELGKYSRELMNWMDALDQLDVKIAGKNSPSAIRNHISRFRDQVIPRVVASALMPVNIPEQAVVDRDSFTPASLGSDEEGDFDATDFVEKYLHGIESAQTSFSSVFLTPNGQPVNHLSGEYRMDRMVNLPLVPMEIWKKRMMRFWALRNSIYQPALDSIQYAFQMDQFEEWKKADQNSNTSSVSGVGTTMRARELLLQLALLGYRSTIQMGRAQLCQMQAAVLAEIRQSDELKSALGMEQKTQTSDGSSTSNWRKFAAGFMGPKAVENRMDKLSRIVNRLAEEQSGSFVRWKEIRMDFLLLERFVQYQEIQSKLIVEEARKVWPEFNSTRNHIPRKYRQRVSNLESAIQSECGF